MLTSGVTSSAHTSCPVAGWLSCVLMRGLGILSSRLCHPPPPALAAGVAVPPHLTSSGFSLSICDCAPVSEQLAPLQLAGSAGRAGRRVIAGGRRLPRLRVTAVVSKHTSRRSNSPPARPTVTTPQPSQRPTVSPPGRSARRRERRGIVRTGHAGPARVSDAQGEEREKERRRRRKGTVERRVNHCIHITHACAIFPLLLPFLHDSDGSVSSVPCATPGLYPVRWW